MEPQTCQISGPIKIYDGLFLGNWLAQADHDWLQLNQVTHIVNCAGLDTPSSQQNNQGVAYLVFEWTETHIQSQLFGVSDVVLTSFSQHMMRARQVGGSVLVYGKDSDSRGCCLLIGYLMKSFGWNLFKTLEFINSRKRDAQLEPQFFQQLNNLHLRLAQSGLIKSSGWDALPGDQLQRIISNTFLNSQTCQQQKMEKAKLDRNRKKIGWKDKEQRGKIEVQYKFSEVQKVSSRDYEPKRMKLRSALKGFINAEDINVNQKRVSVQKDRPRSSNKQVSTQKYSKLTESNLKLSRKNQHPNPPYGNTNDGRQSYQENNKENHTDNINQFFQKNQLMKERSTTFGRLRKSHSKNQPNGCIQSWTKMDIRNLRFLDQQTKRKEGISTSTPIIIVKPNLSMSILHPETKRSTSQKRQEQSLSKTQTPQNCNNYLKVLRAKLNNQGIQPQLLSFKGPAQLLPRRERCSSAKPKTQQGRMKDDLYSISALSQIPTLHKPKWK